MTLRVQLYPPFVHLLALYAREGVMPRLQFKAAMLQAARAETVGFYDDDTIVAAALLYPLEAERPGEDLRELLFVCVPQAARHVRTIVRAAVAIRARWALTPPALAHSAQVRIRATVMRGHAPGERLAALCGLRPVGHPGPVERWELEGVFAWATS